MIRRGWKIFFKSHVSSEPTNQKGFTLIELLVVISIIGLLAVIVLASVNDARERAKNTKLNEIARQYITAFELYRTENQALPSYVGEFCLGYGEGVACSGSGTGSQDLNDDIQKHYNEMPTHDDFEVNNSSGVSYYNDGENKRLIWTLKGGFECVHGADSNPWLPSNIQFTLCFYNL